MAGRWQGIWEQGEGGYGGYEYSPTGGAVDPYGGNYTYVPGAGFIDRTGQGISPDAMALLESSMGYEPGTLSGQAVRSPQAYEDARSPGSDIWDTLAPLAFGGGLALATGGFGLGELFSSAAPEAAVSTAAVAPEAAGGWAVNAVPPSVVAGPAPTWEAAGFLDPVTSAAYPGSAFESVIPNVGSTSYGGALSNFPVGTSPIVPFGSELAGTALTLPNIPTPPGGGDGGGAVPAPPVPAPGGAPPFNLANAALGGAVSAGVSGAVGGGGLGGGVNNPDPWVEGGTGPFATETTEFGTFNPAISSLPSLKDIAGVVGPALSIGSGIVGLNAAGGIKNVAQQASEIQDPFGSQRKKYQEMLAALYANPNSVANMPGYQFGLDQGRQAIERRGAASGSGGNEAIALARYTPEYARNFYTDEVNRLMTLSGAGIPPSGGNALVQGNMGAADLVSKSLASIGYGVRDMGGGDPTLAAFLAEMRKQGWKP